MRFRALPVILVMIAFACVAGAQDTGAAPDPGQNGPGGFSPRAGRGFGAGPGMGMGVAGGRGVMGTVTEADADHFMVRTEDGQVYTVHFSANTRMMKQAAGSGGRGMRRGSGADTGERPPRNMTPPETIKAADIKVGDAIGAMGEVDSSAKSVGAVAIVLLDPETAARMEEMRANYGKTWIQGKVTAIDGVKVTLMGTVDNAAHSFIADENTTFRKRRDPITLTDIQVGDMVRADGAVKGGVFTAATVSVMGKPMGGMQRGPRNAPPPQ